VLVIAASALFFRAERRPLLVSSSLPRFIARALYSLFFIVVVVVVVVVVDAGKMQHGKKFVGKQQPSLSSRLFFTTIEK
jgi:hypothetical protein